MTFATMSYAIGAVFLLATLLVLASRAGIIPVRFVGNKLFPILAGALVFLAVNFNLGPYFAARWRSLWPSAAKGVAAVSQTQAPRAEPVRVRHPAVKTMPLAKPPAADLTGVVVTRGSDAEPGEPAPGTSVPPSPSASAPDPSTQPARSAEDHQGRFKHAVQSVGHFLHITHGAPEVEQEGP